MTEKIRPTIICPECGMEWRDEAPGSVQCPNPECRITFKVDDYGTPRLRSTIICPKCGEICRDEGWESVVCPNPECQVEIPMKPAGDSGGSQQVIPVEESTLLHTEN
jgi:hypothetical protein